MLAGFREGEEEAAAARHARSWYGTLLTAMRHAARSREIAELAVAYRDRGVVGFDIAGAEAGFPPTRHLDAFEYLQRENAHFTIHAGEAFGLPSIWEAIQWCGADRLGPRRADRRRHHDRRRRHRRELGRLAAYVRDKRIPLEMCPTLQRADRRRRLRSPSTRSALLDRAALPGHGQHRQPADERHVDDPRDAAARRRGVRLRPGRPAVVHDQRDEVGVPAVRRAARDHRTTSIKPGYAALGAAH